MLLEQNVESFLSLNDLISIPNDDDEDEEDGEENEEAADEEEGEEEEGDDGMYTDPGAPAPLGEDAPMGYSAASSPIAPSAPSPPPQNAYTVEEPEVEPVLSEPSGNGTPDALCGACDDRDMLCHVHSSDGG